MRNACYHGEVEKVKENVMKTKRTSMKKTQRKSEEDDQRRENREAQLAF